MPQHACHGYWSASSSTVVSHGPSRLPCNRCVSSSWMAEPLTYTPTHIQQEETFMRSYHNVLKPSGRMLARRLDQLRLTLDSLGTRLRSAVSQAVGETV